MTRCSIAVLLAPLALSACAAVVIPEPPDATRSFATAAENEADARAWLDHGRPRPAAKQFLEALRLEPDSPSARLGHAVTLLLAGDVEGARRRFEALDRPSPDGRDARAWLLRMDQPVTVAVAATATTSVEPSTGIHRRLSSSPLCRVVPERSLPRRSSLPEMTRAARAAGAKVLLVVEERSSVSLRRSREGGWPEPASACDALLQVSLYSTTHGRVEARVEVSRQSGRSCTRESARRVALDAAVDSAIPRILCALLLEPPR
jgi:hypothetical protein